MTHLIGTRLIIALLATLLMLAPGCASEGDDGDRTGPSNDREMPKTQPTEPEPTDGEEPEPTSASGSESAPAAAEPTSSQEPDDAWTGVLSNDGTYYVTYAPKPDPIPLNEVFGFDVRIFDGEDRSTRIEDVELAVDGRMPHHRHGMNRVPQVNRNDDGSFTITGMLFHMPGRWELYFDITRDGVTERAQDVVHLD